MDNNETYPCRTALLAFNLAGDVLLLRRPDPTAGRAVFALPAGELRPRETPAQAALRLAEDAGIAPCEHHSPELLKLALYGEGVDAALAFAVLRQAALTQVKV